MKILTINSPKKEQLQEIVNLDKLCFGGLWSLDAYHRELASPNSILLSLSVKEQINGKAKGIKSAATMVTGESSLGMSQPKSLKAAGLIAPEMDNASKEKAQIIGIGCLWAIMEEAHITILGIHPQYQSQGLGKLLLHTLLARAVKRKLEWATLEVRANNFPALSLYQKFGFEIVGKRKKYYQPTGEDALVLWHKGLAQAEFKITLLNWQREIYNRLQEQGWSLVN